MSELSRADRLDGIELSLIVRIQALAGELRDKGIDVIGLGTGEPDFDTPQNIKDAAVAAIQSGDTKYPLTGGTPALKTAVRDKFARENGLEFAPSEIIVSTGAKQVLFNALMATVNPGDEVIIPAPFWGVYRDIVRICGGIPVIIECAQDNGFLLTSEQLRAAISPRTRWLMLNSPSNPSGAAYSGEQLDALMTVVREHPHVAVLSDEIYEHLTYDGNAHVGVLNIAPDLRDRCLIVNGVSKAYAMTGWRIGYAAGPASLISSMVAVQGHVTSGASSIGQAAAAAALNGPQDEVRRRAVEFEKRRDRVVSMLNQAHGIHCPNPNGAFYVFPSCAGLQGKRTPAGAVIASELDFCDYLLKDHGVAVVPGAEFGLPWHFRISYAYAQESLNTACERIQQASAELRD
ncbi:MAG: pyridoxal phosphate-dependent aminotransferase [Pseudomonadota bacterium]